MSSEDFAPSYQVHAFYKLNRSLQESLDANITNEDVNLLQIAVVKYTYAGFAMTKTNHTRLTGRFSKILTLGMKQKKWYACIVGFNKTQINTVPTAMQILVSTIAGLRFKIVS